MRLRADLQGFIGMAEEPQRHAVVAANVHARVLPGWINRGCELALLTQPEAAFQLGMRGDEFSVRK